MRLSLICVLFDPAIPTSFFINFYSIVFILVIIIMHDINFETIIRHQILRAIRSCNWLESSSLWGRGLSYKLTLLPYSSAASSAMLSATEGWSSSTH